MRVNILVEHCLLKRRNKILAGSLQAAADDCQRIAKEGKKLFGNRSGRCCRRKIQNHCCAGSFLLHARTFLNCLDLPGDRSFAAATLDSLYVETTECSFNQRRRNGVLCRAVSVFEALARALRISGESLDGRRVPRNDRSDAGSKDTPADAQDAGNRPGW